MSSQQPSTPKVILSNTLPANGVLPVGSITNFYMDRPGCSASSQIDTSVRTPVQSTGVAVQSYQDDEEGIDCSPCCSNDAVRRTFRNIVYGQILSLCLCGTGVSSQLLSNKEVNTPTAQSFLNYFLLSFIYGSMLVFRKGENSFLTVLRKRGWHYLLLSVVDVEANYIIVYAYQFSNLTSIQLLDCSTIPVVLLLSWLFLSTRYLLTHIIGVGMCLIGIAVLIWADALEGKGAIGGSNRVLGDVLCLTGSVLYAVGNISEEFLIKQNNRVEYLGMIGLFGSIISGIQLAVLEHNELASINWSGTIVMLYLLFAACMFLFYSMVSVVVQNSSALMFNLSILTADFYTLLFGLLLFQYEFYWLYIGSFLIIITGSIMYSIREPQIRDPGEPRIICCLLCRCCINDDHQIPHTSQQFYMSPISTGGDIGIGLANNTVVSGKTESHARITNIQQCPIHGRQLPFVQHQQPGDDSSEHYA
ncbi:unnamed protein product [Thelazia callipaeda]|uniref:Solute carrier family 35 member F1 n=1 Tax=Thelazia callipaeda TaxID=103827 RepID=A0A0N5D8A3_THECL|nr:unnamed protein product [Thelazia callipaeda]